VDQVTQPLQILLTQFLNALPGLVAALVIFFITLYLAALLSRGIRRTLLLRSANDQAVLLVTKVSRWTVVILGLVIALQQVGFNLTAFLTGLGIVGFTIGFALQDVSKNLIAGVIMLFQQPFSIGEAVSIADFSGLVIGIDLRATELHTWDGQVVFIPNATIFTNPITNYSRATRRRVDIPIGVSYSSDMETVRSTALNAVKGIKGLLDDPAPNLLYQEFGGSTINLTLYYWIDTQKNDPLAAKDAGLVAIYSAFKNAGIEMPFPTQTLLLQRESQAREPVD
jgi:small conductance mechanosensitive channel